MYKHKIMQTMRIKYQTTRFINLRVVLMDFSLTEVRETYLPRFKCKRKVSRSLQSEKQQILRKFILIYSLDSTTWDLQN